MQNLNGDSMDKLQGETFRTILKLDNGIEIKANLNNWVLYVPPRSYSYFPTLDYLLTDLLNYKIKLSAVQNPIKDITSLKTAIENSRAEVMAIIKPLTSITNKDLTCSEVQQDTMEAKDD